MTAIRKQSWVAVAALTIATIVLGTTVQLSAAEANKTTLTSKQAKALAGTAKTPDDHMKLAAYFNRDANKLDAEAKDHEELAQSYHANPNMMVGGKSANPGSRTFDHCDAISKSLHDAAKASRELAAEHDQMAKDASK